MAGVSAGGVAAATWSPAAAAATCAPATPVAKYSAANTNITIAVRFIMRCRNCVVKSSADKGFRDGTLANPKARSNISVSYYRDTGENHACAGTLAVAYR